MRRDPERPEKGARLSLRVPGEVPAFCNPDSGNLVIEHGTVLPEVQAKPAPGRGREGAEACFTLIDGRSPGITEHWVRPRGGTRMQAVGKERSADWPGEFVLSGRGLAVRLAVGTRGHAVHGEIISRSPFPPDQGNTEQVEVKAAVNPVAEVEDQPAGGEIVSGPVFTQVPRIESLSKEGQAIISVGPIGREELGVRSVLGRDRLEERRDESEEREQTPGHRG